MADRDGTTRSQRKGPPDRGRGHRHEIRFRRGGSHGIGRGEQRWWDPQWRKERLAAIAEQRQPEVEFDATNIHAAIQEMKSSTDKKEIQFRENYGSHGAMSLQKMAEQDDLFFRSYGKGINRVHVISEEKLPNYRADLDKKHGQSQTMVSISVDTSEKVRQLISTSEYPETPTVKKNITEPFLQRRAGNQSQKEVSQNVHKSDGHSESTADPLVLAAMAGYRNQLPASKVKETFLDILHKNQVVIVSGETGCGKTTQLPQFVLEAMAANHMTGNIICTQPRRISAVSVSGRVAQERGEHLGDRVGFQIRLESNLSPQTRLLFCTAGVLLRKLVGDPDLEGTSVVFLDEVHERGLNEDFAMIVLKDLLARRVDLKVVLMSATINADSFSRYFHGAPLLHIPGFTHPVEQLFLEDVIEAAGVQILDKGSGQGARDSPKAATGPNREDMDPISKLWKDGNLIETKYSHLPYSVKTSLKNWSTDVIDLDLVAKVVEHICTAQGEGAILIFLTGWDEISTLVDTFSSSTILGDTNRFRILPLHSSMPTVNQREIFDRPPRGTRKIIVATNIAESSITVDDVVYVLDCGKSKEKSYDALNKLSCVTPTWISMASARQRMGRAGRVRPGVCYHLYPKVIFDMLPAFPAPEMLRTSLHELCLQIKSMGLGRVQPFLERAMQPPDPHAVRNALDLLLAIGAINTNEELTPLGRHLALLPVDPRVGKLLLFGTIFGCLESCLTVAAGLGFRNPFVIPLGKQREADDARRRFDDGSYSDHITLVKVYTAWVTACNEGTSGAFCWRNFISAKTMEMMAGLREQFRGLLVDMGFCDTQNSNTPASASQLHDNLLLRAIICAGLFPSVARMKQRGKRLVIQTKEDGPVSLHPTSVVNSNSVHTLSLGKYLVYGDKVKTSKIFLRDSTVVSDIVLLLFGGELQASPDGDGVQMLDGYLQFYGHPEVLSLIKKVRSNLDAILRLKIEKPEQNLQAMAGPIIEAVLELLRGN